MEHLYQQPFLRKVHQAHTIATTIGRIHRFEPHVKEYSFMDPTYHINALESQGGYGIIVKSASTILLEAAYQKSFSHKSGLQCIAVESYAPWVEHLSDGWGKEFENLFKKALEVRIEKLLRGEDTHDSDGKPLPLEPLY